MLALPVLNLELGSSDNGELPKSTTARQAFDLITEGFGPGANGPLLIGVKLGSPAKPDQSSSTRSTSSSSKLNQQTPQQEEQLEAEGVPAVAGAAAGRSSRRRAQQQQLDQQKKLAASPATDTRLTDLENAIKKDPGIKSVSPATRRQGGHRRGASPRCRPPPRRTRDTRTSSSACATT